MLTFNSFIPKFNGIQPAQNRYTAVPKYPNLAPLARDTVSFGRTDKNISNNPKFGISLAAAKKINIDAEDAKNYLERQLTDILSDMIRPESGEGSLSKPIKTINYRVKTPKSIREKSMTRRWINEKEVKSGMTDIVGARILMSDASVDNVDKVLRRLADGEDNNKLQIIEIENYRPEPEIDENGNITKSYDYASPQALRKLKSECDKKGTMISKRDEDVPTGYMAIHLLTKLPNGFTGEIQIMGTDVAELKEIEDLCYKVKSGKSIDKKYEPIKRMLSPLSDRNDIMLQREYNNYTRKAYIHQRNKEPIKIKNAEITP